jgi:hypothetical protein
MWALGYHWSVAVAIGFIALAGVAAETGVVMLIYLDHAWKAHRARTDHPTVSDLYAAVIEGAVERVRPKMMTVTAIMAGLLPILWGAGTGASVMKRIVAPMVVGALRADVKDGRVLVVAITGSITPGRYTVRWRVASADGHTVRGKYIFPVGRAASIRSSSTSLRSAVDHDASRGKPTQVGVCPQFRTFMLHGTGVQQVS